MNRLHPLELVVPPPLVAALAMALMWASDAAFPALRLEVPAARWVALALALAGFSIEGAGVAAFLRARTTVNPIRPHKAVLLVTGGPYRFTRNPMYLGWLPILAGWAVYLGQPLALAGLPLFVLYLTRFQIVPEERVLREKFGAQFDEFCRRVPRWL